MKLSTRLPYPLFASLCLLTTSAGAQTPSIVNITYGNWLKVAQAPVDTAQWMHFPRAIAFDVKSGNDMIRKTLLNWQTNADVVMWPMSHGWAGSVNEAVTFNSPAPVITGGYKDLDMMGCVRRNTDGVLVAIPFYFNNNGSNATPPLKFSYYTSVDNGATWIKQDSLGRVTGFPAGQQVAGFRFHRGIIQNADGALYAPAYVQFRNTDGTYQVHRSVLVRSTDGGTTWNYVSTIQYTSNLAYNETTIVRCKDGSILAVMRNGSNSLKYRRSPAGSNGSDWGPAVSFLPDLPSNQGVDPYLQLLPNGILALSYGDNIPGNGRNCMMAYATDGVGNNFTNITPTFTGSAGLGNKSSGYTSTISLRNNRMMQISDRALYSYYGSTHHPSPNPFSIWTRIADIVTNYRNRIDLKSKYPTGQVAVNTDMTYTNAVHPEAGIPGAFDATTDYWNGAFKMSNSGYYTVDLKDTVTINGISVCLLYGVPQSATVECSVDNSNWTTLRTYNNETHYTVDYTSVATVPARYVRVNVTGTSGKVGVNELNIFSSAETYEDFAQNVVPYGYTASDAASPDFWVSEGVTPLPTGYQSKRALYMYDNDGANKELRKTDYTASAAKTLEFRLRTKGFATNGCVQFRLMSGTTNAFRIAVFSTGILAYYRSDSGWITIGSGPVSVPLDTWKKIKVVANASTNTASVYVDGLLIGNATKQTVSATTMNGFLFASTGSAAVGDKALFDDVELYDTATGLPKEAIEGTITHNIIADKGKTGMLHKRN